VIARKAESADEVSGVNDRSQLARLERIYQRGCAEALMGAGVTMADPARFDLRGEITVGSDVFIDCNVIIEGQVVIGDRVRIGANCLLRNVQIGDDTQIEPMSLLDGASVGEACQVGPFARLRPGTELADGAKIGNFVEVKKSRIGRGSKVNHLSYIGDTQMGSGVNVGAGTITCNYDGANKHQTIIGDNAFIGSDSQLVAPVSIGAGATIGAGSTITSDTPENALTLSRSKQRSLENWKRPVKK
jgi:bifunctional UDP-N-acetylglucosamine pyrophosphorylase/glucosamine-1-phosphate N-acetyltransferase